MTPVPLRYRAVLFDLDGTLVDSYAALAEAVNFASEEDLAAAAPDHFLARFSDLLHVVRNGAAG